MKDPGAEAAAELLRRRECRDNFLPFVEYTHPSWTTGTMHIEICKALEAVERGEIDRLAIFAPPRHGKSELATRRFPAWYLGKHPERQIICASYGGDLAKDMGADVRDILSDEYYQNVFPGTALRKDAKAAGRWRTTGGGIYVSAGVDGPIVGRGAHLAVIDDPVKGRSEADSERMRNLAGKWYFGDLLTRMMPDTHAIVLMMTRWHEDDLAGRVLKAEDWTVIELPAISDEGTPEEKALFPERYDMPKLTRIRDAMIKGGRGREWTSQFQQKPVPDTGGYIRTEWFEDRYETAPDGLFIYMASDFAVGEPGEGQEPDYTEHGVFGLGEDDQLFVLDWWSGQTTSDVWIDSLLTLMEKWKPHCWFGEKGAIRNAVRPFLAKEAQMRRVYYNEHWVATTTKKAVRGRAFQAWAASGRIRFPRTPWAERVVSQVVGFPGVRFDDKFDVMALMCLAIDEAAPGIVRSATAQKRRNDYNVVELHPGLNWKTA